jgi:putative transposase
MSVCSALYPLLRALLKSRFSVVTENLALRQQLVILRRNTSRLELRDRDRLFWVVLSHLWRDWRSILVIVKPETVIKWHRQGFKCYWRWKSRAGRVGRPRIDREIRDLIRHMSHENPTWGVPRIQAELHLLGYKVAESTVAKYKVRIRKPPSQTWKSFLSNHANEIVAIDFFTRDCFHRHSNRSLAQEKAHGHGSSAGCDDFHRARSHPCHDPLIILLVWLWL